MPRQTWLALLTPSLFIILILWLPFGFGLSGLIEEWDVLGLFTTHGLFFVADATSPLAAHSLRPLTILPHALAYFMDPNSFDYWHVLLMLALVVKGGASSYLALKSTRSLGWAIFMGILVLVYPADTMQLSFRSLHINLALALLLLAASLHVAAYNQPRGAISCCVGLVGAGLLLVCILMYEAALALVPLPFLIMFARDGIRGTWQSLRARPDLALSWMAAAGLFVVYVLLAASNGTSYHSSIGSDRGAIAILYDALPKLFSIGVLRGLLGGWFDAALMVWTEFSSYTYISLASLACAGLILWREKTVLGSDSRYSVSASLSRQAALRLGLAGVVLLILGYAPYLFSGAHMAISQRTFLFATPGAALVWLALLIMLAKFSKLVAGMAAFGLLLLGLGAQLFQFHHYVQLAATQRTILRSIVENFDGNLGSKTLVIFDASNRLNHTWMLRDNLHWALSYLYKRPFKPVEICLVPGGGWQRFDALARMGRCIENKDHWTFQAARPVAGPGLTLASPSPDFTIAKADVVSLTINADGSISRAPALDAYRERLLRGKDDAALRYRHILAGKYWSLGLKQFQAEEAQERYRWDFGKWWSLEVPTRGSGWREAEWHINQFRHQSVAWKSQERSTLLFDFAPTDKIYRVEGQFDVIVNQAIKDGMRIRMNGRDLIHRWGDDGRFEASIPAGILISGLNTIEFNSATVPDYYGLSARLDWFEVRANSWISIPESIKRPD